MTLSSDNGRIANRELSEELCRHCRKFADVVFFPFMWTLLASAHAIAGRALKLHNVREWTALAFQAGENLPSRHTLRGGRKMNTGRDNPLTLVLAWLWAGLAGLAGALLFLRPGQILSGILLLLSALAACPLCVSLLEKQSGTRLGGGSRLVLVLAFAALAGIGIAQNPAAMKSWLPAPSVPPVPVPKTLLEANGDFGNLATKAFTPQGADWTLEWSFDCASLGDSGNFRAQVVRSGGAVLANVERISERDSGTERYHATGTFTLQVVSECKWSVRVTG
jgi:hypothetical protein